jgi:4-amino-4-deoxy-L-arabinose transferase and related glycosyltransferases of PMT family
LAAGVLLVAAIGISCLASWRLKLEERRPARTLPYFAVFGATLVLAFVAGRFVQRPRAASAVPDPFTPLPFRVRFTVAIAAAAALGCSALTWYLQGNPRSPWLLLLAWSAALLACVVAFSAWRGTPSLAWPTRRFGGVEAAILLVLILAACARLIGLDSMPPYMGGDEANQVLDGLATMRGGVDVLGIGWGATGRLAMLPGGVGATVFADPIGGPRLPYAVAGILSVVACTVAAGLVAGRWGALACAALLAFSPHHVHFSRLASVQILDALAVGLLFLLLLAVHWSGSASLAALAGIVGGLALYGYSGGRAITVAFLLMLPFTALTAPKRRRVAVLLGLVAGFAIASAPNFRYAFRNYGAWNGRFIELSIFRPDYWNSRMAIFGSPVKVLQDQFLSGTIDLLSRHSGWAWFQGYPLIAPFFLVPLFLAGLGWMVGRRQFFGAATLSLVAAGNFAALILTESAPAPQRASSLVPAMAVLGGAAIGGLLSLLPERDRRGISWRAGAGAILIAGVLTRTYHGPPRVWDPSPGYGGDGSAFTTALYKALSVPRFSQGQIYLHSIINSHFPLFAYFLPRVRWIDVPEAQEQQPLSGGLHVFFRERMPLGQQWKERLQIRHEVLLADPDDPRRSLALLLRVPG